MKPKAGSSGRAKKLIKYLGRLTIRKEVRQEYLNLKAKWRYG